MSHAIPGTLPSALFETIEGDAFTVLPASDEPEPGPVPPPVPRRGLLGRVRDAIASACEWLFGALAVVLGLAVLSTTPVFQLVSFGYLLESGGRVARSGRLRDAFIGVRQAARLGSVVIGCTLVYLPLRLVASWAASAQLVDPGGTGGAAVADRAGGPVGTGGLARGGRVRGGDGSAASSGRSARRCGWSAAGGGGVYRGARDAVWEFVAALRLPYYFRLGLLGFVGTFAWLVLPVTLIAAGRRFPPAAFVGGLLLAVAALALPFLQMQFAAEDRLGALFEYRRVRDRFRRAPWAFAIAALATLAFALPLYLLKIEMIPRETAWLPGLLFLAFILPARTLTGWAYARSGRRDRPRHWFFRGTARLAMLPIGLAYALIVFFTQFTAWQGIWSLYEQHAFLLPVPFLNM